MAPLDAEPAKAAVAPAPAPGPSPAQAVADALHDGKKHLLLAATGSVAAIKLPLMAAALADVPGLSVRIIVTPSAARFLEGQAAEQPPVAALRRIANVDAVYCGDDDEWAPPWVRGAPILHIELRRWADLLVIAPLSANVLAKLAHGLCDSLLTCVVRAWDTDPAAAKRILVAPSMNTAMWHHPLTARQLATLRDAWGTAPDAPVYPSSAPAASAASAAAVSWYEILLPQSKALACGDVGLGAMADWRDIVQIIRERLSLPTVDAAEAAAPET